MNRIPNSIYQVSNENNCEKFIQKLEKINRERVSFKSNQIPIQKEKSDDTEVVVDLDPKKLNKPKDAVFMDFMALYSRALNTDSSVQRR